MLNANALVAIVEQIQAAGLVATLRADMPVDLLLEVGDALLASPILVVAVPVAHPEAAALLSAYSRRFGKHLLVGADGIATVDQGAMVLGAGADFLITTRYQSELHQLATRCGALYIPPATAPAAVPALQQMDVLMATIHTDTLLAVAPWPVHTTPALLALAAAQPSTIAHCAHAGATAVAVGAGLQPTIEWSMPTLIRTARGLRQSWLDAVAQRV